MAVSAGMSPPHCFKLDELPTCLLPSSSGVFLGDLTRLHCEVSVLGSLKSTPPATQPHVLFEHGSIFSLKPCFSCYNAERRWPTVVNITVLISKC